MILPMMHDEADLRLISFHATRNRDFTLSSEASSRVTGSEMRSHGWTDFRIYIFYEVKFHTGKYILCNLHISLTIRLHKRGREIEIRE